MEKAEIKGDYIQLDQFLKRENRIASGGETGFFLEEHDVRLNGEKVREKRKKLRPGDILEIDGKSCEIIGEGL